MLQKIIQAINELRISKLQLAIRAGVNPPDLYQALNGKKPFFPKWRKAVSRVLEVPESELFPEYELKSKEEEREGA